MADFTTRTGLTKPFGNEQRSRVPLNANFDIIDKFLGCILVNDGVTPPTGDLFDGALVREKTSGILWEARKNGGGTYDKVYVRYPFYFQGSMATNVAIAANVSPIEIGLTAVNSSYLKNASAANIVSGRFSAPVKGIYQYYMRMVWAANAAGDRYIQFMLNGSVVSGATEYQKVQSGASLGGAAQPAVQELVGTTILSVGDQMSVGAQQTSGGSLYVTDLHTKIVLVEPVQ